MAEEAVQLAVKTWGQRSITELEAEERLSYSCEKVIFGFYSVETSYNIVSNKTSTTRVLCRMKSSQSYAAHFWKLLKNIRFTQRKKGRR